MMAMAMGMRISEPGPMPSAGGIAAIRVETAVITIGRRRIGPAFSMASRGAEALLRGTCWRNRPG